MRRNAVLIAIAVFVLAAGAGWWMSSRPAERRPATLTPASVAEIPASHAAAAGAAEIPPSPGQIMGIGIGSPIDEAREKLDPLREPGESAPEGEKEEGERVYWKLKETEYSWIIAWADDEGKITRMRAMLRPEQSKPFSELGDLAVASVNQPNTVAWNLTAADGTPVRIIAQGPAQRATTIYMFSLRTREAP